MVGPVVLEVAVALGGLRVQNFSGVVPAPVVVLGAVGVMEGGLFHFLLVHRALAVLGAVRDGEVFRVLAVAVALPIMVGMAVVAVWGPVEPSLSPAVA